MSGSLSNRQPSGPVPIITALVFGATIAGATGGAVVPGHDWAGAAVVFGVSVLYLLAGWFLRGWGGLTADAVRNIIHDELESMRKEEMAYRRDIWTAIDKLNAK